MSKKSYTSGEIENLIAYFNSRYEKYWGFAFFFYFGLAFCKICGIFYYS
jgi:hypothetical protein